MRIQIIKKEESKYSSRVVSNKLYTEETDLNKIYNDSSIENIKIIITKSSQELEDKEKRLKEAMGGYTSSQRLLRYFLLFFLTSFITLWVLFFTQNFFPEHIYAYNLFIILFFNTIVSIFIGSFGFLFDSIFMIIRLITFERNEKKRKNNV